MKKHASSHGLAVLVCTVCAGILIHIGKERYPSFLNILDEFSNFIITKFGLDYSVDDISTLILAVVLAVVWGIAFSFMHSDSKSEKRNNS